MPQQPPDDASTELARVVLLRRPAVAHFAPRPRAAASQGDEQLLGEAEQTLADSDQTLADADQTGADTDQTSADTDQLAADSDQAASDRDLAAGADAAAHRFSRDIRERSARQRGRTARARLVAAEERDATAHNRDLVAQARDQAADARDLAMRQRDVAYEQQPGAFATSGAEIIMRAAEQRKRAARHRAQAAEHRELAAGDRQSAARDREQGARERLRSLVDREAFARELTIVETDPTTGARMRAAGLTDFDHELDRCRGTDSTLVVAYVDVVGLKIVNDSEGQRAGDALLKKVIHIIGEHMRSYDLIVRLGGDEFLCAMPSVTLADVQERFSAIASALAGAPGAPAIRAGFAEFGRDDSATELIARADSALVASRPRNQDGRD